MRDSVAGLIFGNVAEVEVGGFDDGVHSVFTVIVPIPLSQLWRGDQKVLWRQPTGAEIRSARQREDRRVCIGR